MTISEMKKSLQEPPGLTHWPKNWWGRRCAEIRPSAKTLGAPAPTIKESFRKPGTVRKAGKTCHGKIQYAY